MSAAVAGVLLWAAGLVAAKHIDIGAASLAAWRFGLVSIVLVVGLAIVRDPLRRSTLRATSTGGVAIGVEVLLSFTAVQLTTVANVAVITSLQPVVVLFLARVVLHESVAAVDAIFGLVAFGGVLVVVTSSSGVPAWDLGGDLIALAAVGCFSTYLVTSRRRSLDVGAMQFTAGTVVWGTVVCTPVAVIVDRGIDLPAGAAWWWMAVLVVGAGVVGHVAVNWSLGRQPLWLVATATLLLVPAAAVLGWLTLDERMRPVQIGATAVVVAALAAVVGRRREGTGGLSVAR